MFHHVCIGTASTLNSDLADALAYYDLVSVDGNAGAIAKLCAEFGFEQIRDLIDAGALRLGYLKHQYGVLADGGVPKTHGFVSFSLARSADHRRVRGAADAIEIALRRAMPGDHRVTKIAKTIGDRVVEKPYYSDIETLSVEDMRDDQYRSSAMYAILQELAPSLVSGKLSVPIIEVSKGRFFVDVPVDFRRVNEICNRDVAKEGAIDTAHLMSHILSARQHLLAGAHSSADMWLPPSSAALINLRINSIAARVDGGRDEIEAFSNVVFDGRSFADAISDGSRSAAELVKFVLDEETKRMKRWIAQQSPDVKLVTEYTKAVEGRGLMDRVPVRAAKVAVFTLAGIALDALLRTPGLAVAGALALNTVDESIASKLRLGWRPNVWAQRGRKFLSQS